MQLGFLSRSMSNLGTNSTLSSGMSRLSHRTRQSSGSDLSTAANDLIMDYMRKLHDKLNTSELTQFASLIKTWQNDMCISSFCETVLHLYGPERKHLLADMKPFIPAKDLDYFERFLEKNVLASDEDFEVISVPMPDLRGRRISQMRSPWQTASVDQDLDCIDTDIDDVTDRVQELPLRHSINMHGDTSD
jgi:hypothetical protein